MTTLTININPTLNGNALDIRALSVTGEDIPVDLNLGGSLRVQRDGQQIEVNLPNEVDVQFVANGFTEDTTAYAATAESTYRDDAPESWSVSGSNSVSPVFSLEGRYVFEVTATGGGNSPTVKTIVRVRRKGKGDDVLASFA